VWFSRWCMRLFAAVEFGGGSLLLCKAKIGVRMEYGGPQGKAGW